MRAHGLAVLAVAWLPTWASAAPALDPPDPRLWERTYDLRAVVTVPVKRGVVTHVVLDDDEVITDVGAGLGGDCSRADAAWCIAAQSGSRHVFVKAKAAAREPNNLAVVTDRRTYAFRFVVLGDRDARQPVYRLVMKAPAPPTVAVRTLPALQGLPLVDSPAPPPTSPAQVVAERMKASAEMVNTDYALAEGDGAGDIVPTLVFDDGRFTYLRFPGNREVPAVFHVLGDGSETLVNTRMEGDLLVVDRVSRRLILRAGSAVVGIWNEAFDLEGRPPASGTTVPGVERVDRETASVSATDASSGAGTANGTRPGVAR